MVHCTHTLGQLTAFLYVCNFYFVILYLQSGFDTGDKFVSGFNDTAERFIAVTQLINIHSRLSPRIFEKIRNDPHVILRGRGDTDL
jgi:hypothetical protein